MPNIGMIIRLITGITPELRRAVTDSLDQMEAAAKRTAFPLDDMVVRLMRLALTMIGIL